MTMFSPLNSAELQEIAVKLESLNKSFAAGFPGLQNAGRTQTSAIAVDNLEPTMRSLTLEEGDFHLVKDIQTVPAKSTVYQYVVKTAVRSGIDLWGIEQYLPQEDHAKYMRVAEVLKVQGIRKTITHMAQLVNEAGGYMVDLDAENDQNAALAMSESLERALYNGGDFYIDSTGAIDATIAANINGPIRQIRGIQAQIREGNRSARGIIGDFVGFGNNQLTYMDAKGSTIDRYTVDKLASAVRNARGKLEEAHCTTNQLQAFRATFFPFERGDLGSWYNPQGAGVDADYDSAFPLRTVTGVIKFIPSIFKFNRIFPEAIHGSVGSAPNAPGTLVNVVQSASNTSYKAGEVVRYVAQAWSINGASNASAELVVTIAADGNRIAFDIPAVTGAEEFWVFRTDVGGASGTQKFIGRVIASRVGGATSFMDDQALLPAMDAIVFMPKKANRAKLAVLGNLLTKMQLGRLGLLAETIYVSYLACIVEWPRHHGLINNVYQDLELSN